jgi:hypothetical protein
LFKGLGEKIFDYAVRIARKGNAVILTAGHRIPPPKESMDRRRSITASSFKILFKDGQPGRCRLGNGKAVARELPPAFGGAGRGG